MKRIVIVDHFSQTPDEPGNNRFIYLARFLCSRGHQVEIITTDFSHKSKKTRQTDAALLEALPYEYTMLPEPGYPKNVCLQRFRSHYVFGRNLKNYLNSTEKPGLVLAAVPSLDVGKVAADYCREHNIPFVVDIQDLWPEAFKLIFHIPVVSDFIFAPMTLMADKLYAQADTIVAVSETYKQRGLCSNQKDREGLCVYLGTDLEAFDRNADRFSVSKTDEEIWVAYVGTLGHSYDIEIIMDALDLLPKVLTGNLVFKVMGDGPLMERFRSRAHSCKVYVDFLGRIDYPNMTAYLKCADIAVNPIAKGAAQSIINKHADYAAAGLPVVSTQECPEYRNLLETYNCGINCPPEDAQSVAAALEKLLRNPTLRKEMGHNSRKMAEERFDRAHTYLKIVQTLETLIFKDM